MKEPITKAMADKYKMDIFNTPAEAHENAQRQILDIYGRNKRYLGCEKLADYEGYIQKWNVWD